MRLIDADRLKAVLEKNFSHTGGASVLEQLIDEQPMIIQPEKAELSQEGTTSDMISKTETVEHLRIVLGATVPITDYDDGFVDGVQFAISTVSTMPTIQPETQKGEWSDGYRWQRCSLCKQTGKKSWNYCPNCGARMKEAMSDLIDRRTQLQMNIEQRAMT